MNKNKTLDALENDSFFDDHIAKGYKKPQKEDEKLERASALVNQNPVASEKRTAESAIPDRLIPKKLVFIEKEVDFTGKKPIYVSSKTHKKLEILKTTYGVDIMKSATNILDFILDKNWDTIKKDYIKTIDDGIL